jgi:uncharacterized protein involved in oxidation of intracellular sulfur
MKHLILLNDPPYGTERSFNGLRMAHALGTNDPETASTVSLMTDGGAPCQGGSGTARSPWIARSGACQVG